MTKSNHRLFSEKPRSGVPARELEGMSPTDLVHYFLFYAISLAHNAHRKYQNVSGCAVDDLTSAAFVGLWVAARNYDFKRGETFETYSRHRIEGAIIDYVRKISPVTRGTREKMAELKLAEDLLIEDSGRKPNTTELADLLLWKEKTVREIRNIQSETAVVFSEETMASYYEQPKYDSAIDLRRALVRLRDHLQGLPPRLRILFGLLSEEGVSSKEAADLMDLPRATLRQLKEKLILACQEIINDGSSPEEGSANDQESTVDTSADFLMSI